MSFFALVVVALKCCFMSGGFMSATDGGFFHYHTMLLVNRWVDEIRMSMVAYFVNLIFHSSDGSEKSVFSLVSQGLAHWVVLS